MHAPRLLRSVLPMLALALVATACGGGGGNGGDNPPADTVANRPPADSTPSDSTPSDSTPPTAGQTITIRVVTTESGASGVFEPATVTAKRGDVLHFVGDGGAAHNVSIVNSAGAPVIPGGQYLTTDGQALDVPVTLAPGTYTFQCDPHLATGMKGTLTVTG